MTMPRALLAALCTTVLFHATLAEAQYTGQCRTSADLAEIPKGHWCEIPDSHLEDQEKKPEKWPDWNGTSSASYDSYQRQSGIKAIIENWSGGTWDSRRDRLVIFGGGHNGYGGNEIFVFDLNTLAWERLTDPTPFSKRSPAWKNGDETPISRHTYGGLAYVEPLDRMFVFGGAPDSEHGGAGVRGTWMFSFTDLVWELRTMVDEPPSKAEDNAIYDPVTKRVLYHFGTTPSGWAAYEYEANTWTALNAIGTNGGVVTVIPGERRFIVEFGRGNVDGYNRWNLDSPTLERDVVSTTGARDMEAAANPGTVYDPTTDRIVSWSGGTTVYSLDVDTNVWEAHPAAGTNLVDPGPVDAAGGTYGRFQYSATYNVFVTVDSVSENVFVYRFALGTP